MQEYKHLYLALALAATVSILDLLATCLSPAYAAPQKTTLILQQRSAMFGNQTAYYQPDRVAFVNEKWHSTLLILGDKQQVYFYSPATKRFYSGKICEWKGLQAFGESACYFEPTYHWHKESIEKILNYPSEKCVLSNGRGLDKTGRAAWFLSSYPLNTSIAKALCRDNKLPFHQGICLKLLSIDERLKTVPKIDSFKAKEEQSYQKAFELPKLSQYTAVNSPVAVLDMSAEFGISSTLD
jgi:hypothetical protein